MTDSPTPGPAALPDLSAAPRARLFTVWNTALYVDRRSGELLHGAIDTSPTNALFVADPTSLETARHGWLMHDTSAGLEPIVCRAEGSRPASSAASDEAMTTATRFEVVPLERGLIGLRAENLYLCAEPDARLTLSKQRCSTWECYLASEDWCSLGFSRRLATDKTIEDKTISWWNVRNVAINPFCRMEFQKTTKARRILIYGHTYWSNGRIYYGVCKHLYNNGFIADLLDWQNQYSLSQMHDLLEYYEYIITGLDGISILVDSYGVPYGRIIGITHGAYYDFPTLIAQKGLEVFEMLANFGVTSYSMVPEFGILGVPRVPMVASVGVNFQEFYTEISQGLETVGYATSMSAKTRAGVEAKRGYLAEECARDAGLKFRNAGDHAHPIPFHDMPEFYKTVDALLMTSTMEAAPSPVLEGAAAGRLVIGTPAGHFPLLAYQGAGILAPFQSIKYKEFVVQTLTYYKQNPSAYIDKCQSIQEAVRRFDWEHMIGEWVELIETARCA
jgi:hypothetical protein